MSEIENCPELWSEAFNFPDADSYKYRRGQVLVSAGVDMTGAALLAGRAALRAGAGLVRLAISPETRVIFALGQPEFLLHDIIENGDFESLLADNLVDNHNYAILLGSGAGLVDGGKVIRGRIRAALRLGRPVVIDADGLNGFEGRGEEFFELCHDKVVLTPHEGEFSRLFGKIEGGDRVSFAKKAAEKAGCVVVLKGAETIISAADGRVIVNKKASPFLATAGSGDVLAGIISGLLASEMPVFEAAAAAVWLHGAVALEFGAGLIASDIIDGLPLVLEELYEGGNEI